MAADSFDLLDDIESFDDLAEDDVLAVQPRGWDGGDEELGALGVWSSIGHAEVSRSSVLDLEVFV